MGDCKRFPPIPAPAMTLGPGGQPAQAVITIRARTLRDDTCGEFLPR